MRVGVRRPRLCVAKEGRRRDWNRWTGGKSVKGEIYLDNNATTRPLPAVRAAMYEALDEGFGNPSSDHARGQRARDALHRARSSLAALVGAEPSQLTFTSSATEANNLVLASAACRDPQQGAARFVTSRVEHSSILKACEHFADRGAEVVYVPVDAEGVVDLDALSNQLTARTSLVSIQWANNETGVVQPISQISALCHSCGVPLHVDAAQAIGKLDLDLGAIGVDFVSLTAHKLHGPVGVGAVYTRDPGTLQPLFFGGPQEAGLRPGTENLPAIVGFGVAAELRRKSFAMVEGQLRELRDALEERVMNLVADVIINGQGAERLSNTTNLRFAGVDGQALVARLDQAGVRCSQSSACTSRHPEPSSVLRAMGLSTDDAWSSVRFSFGEWNGLGEATRAADLIAEICGQLRRFQSRRPVPHGVEVG
jgi:cysteine desulfurase